MWILKKPSDIKFGRDWRTTYFKKRHTFLGQHF